MGFKKNTPGRCCCGAPTLYIVRDDYVHLFNSDLSRAWTDSLPSTLALSPQATVVGVAQNRDLQLVDEGAGTAVGKAIQYELDGTRYITDIDAHIAANYDSGNDAHAEIAEGAAHDGLWVVWYEYNFATGPASTAETYAQKLVRGSWSGSKTLLKSYALNMPGRSVRGLPDGKLVCAYNDSAGDARFYHDGTEYNLSTTNTVTLVHLYNQSSLITEIASKRRRFDDATEITSGSWPVSSTDTATGYGLGHGFWVHDKTRNYAAGIEFSGSLLAALGADNSAANDLMLKQSVTKDVSNNEFDVEYQNYKTGATSTVVYAGDGAAILTAGERVPWAQSVYDYPTDP